MQIERNIDIQGKTQRPIPTDVFYKANGKPKPILIFCHGYKGYKDWGAWNFMAERMAEKGIFFIKFNFSHNGGTLENPIDFPDLEAFAKDNYSKQLADLESVITWILNSTSYGEELDSNRLGLLGHSRGGGIVLLKAAEDPRVQKVVSFAGVSDFESRFPTGEKLKQWEKEGVYYVENSRTHQKMPHYFQFYEDFMAHRDRLDIAQAVRRLQIPQLIVHAADDTSVSPQEAKKLHSWNPKSELFLIENGAHTFGAKQPWPDNRLPVPLKNITDKTIQFIKS